MTPSERVMPIVVAEGLGEGFRLHLPGRVERIAVDAEEARRIVAREAPGSAIHFVPPRAKGKPTK